MMVPWWLVRALVQFVVYFVAGAAAYAGIVATPRLHAVQEKLAEQQVSSRAAAEHLLVVVEQDERRKQDAVDEVVKQYQNVVAQRDADLARVADDGKRQRLLYASAAAALAARSASGANCGGNGQAQPAPGAPSADAAAAALGDILARTDEFAQRCAQAADRCSDQLRGIQALVQAERVGQAP